MCRPGKHRNQENNHVERHQVQAEYALIAQNQDNDLHDSKDTYARQRAKRAPLRPRNKKQHTNGNSQPDKDKPWRLAREPYPEHTKRRGNAFPPFKTHSNGEYMPDNNKQTAKITRQITHPNLRACKGNAAVYKEGNKPGDTAF